MIFETQIPQASSLTIFENSKENFLTENSIETSKLSSTGQNANSFADDEFLTQEPQIISANYNSHHALEISLSPQKIDGKDFSCAKLREIQEPEISFAKEEANAKLLEQKKQLELEKETTLKLNKILIKNGLECWQRVFKKYSHQYNLIFNTPKTPKPPSTESSRQHIIDMMAVYRNNLSFEQSLAEISAQNNEIQNLIEPKSTFYETLKKYKKINRFKSIHYSLMCNKYLKLVIFY